LETTYRAWVLVDAEGARRRAGELDDLRRRGQSAGPLHGIPLGVKDIFDTAGWPTLAGSPLRAGHVAAVDAPLVRRLRESGAILLGKTVTTEFACFDPPPTRNPWNPAHTPGGSSSGSAAGVALGMCLGAVGSQTGGSITRPASYCGVCGAKPTIGALERRGIVPVSFHLDHPGAIGQSAADLHVLIACMAGPRTHDRWKRAGGAADGLTAPRLGILGEFFHDEADQETRQAIDVTVERLRTAGATCQPAALPPSFAQVHRHHWRIMAVEAALVHREAFERDRDAYSNSLAALLDEGLRTGSLEYAQALAHQRQFRGDAERLALGFDALVCPATPTPAPSRLDTTGDPRFNSPWSYAGLPTVSLPIALSSAGMPIGLQLVASAWSEPRLFAVAGWCERAIGWERGRPARSCVR
jgi:aspartyl-tRNA(Asn)/glutamyl-tRNA(Gln) amidotransferase subunit A